jgi:hypothetical protein
MAHTTQKQPISPQEGRTEQISCVPARSASIVMALLT